MSDSDNKHLCLGKCGGTVDDPRYRYCPDCQKGADILNRNAIKNLREQRDEARVLRRKAERERNDLRRERDEARAERKVICFDDATERATKAEGELIRVQELLRELVETAPACVPSEGWWVYITHTFAYEQAKKYIDALLKK